MAQSKDGPVPARPLFRHHRRDRLDPDRRSAHAADHLRPIAVSRQMYDELKDDVANLVRHQRDLCNKLATEARKVLEKLGCLEENASRAQTLQRRRGRRERGPAQDVARRQRDCRTTKFSSACAKIPTLRAQIEKWDIYFYGDRTKKSELKPSPSSTSSSMSGKMNMNSPTKGSTAGSKTTKRRRPRRFRHARPRPRVRQDRSRTRPLRTRQNPAESRLREEDAQRKERAHNLRQLLRAHLLMEKDVDYIIAEEQDRHHR